MYIVWGEQLGFLYNAAYAPLTAARHLDALGSPAATLWPSLWDTLEPLVAKARRDEAELGEDIIRTNRSDGREHERAFSMAYPTLHGDGGAQAGTMCAVSETTAQERLLQRRAFQLNVADQLAALSDPGAFQFRCSVALPKPIERSPLPPSAPDRRTHARRARASWRCDDCAASEF